MGYPLPMKNEELHPDSIGMQYSDVSAIESEDSIWHVNANERTQVR